MEENNENPTTDKKKILVLGVSFLSEEQQLKIHEQFGNDVEIVVIDKPTEEIFKARRQKLTDSEPILYRAQLEIPKLPSLIYDENNRSKQELNAELVPVRSEAKISRNSPCPCNSGKKYKKCCMKN